MSTTDLVEAAEWCKETAVLLWHMDESERRGERLTRSEKRLQKDLKSKLRQMTIRIRKQLSRWNTDDEAAN